MGKRVRKSSHSSVRSVGRGFYRLLVVLSAMIVALFVAYKLIRRQPSFADGPQYNALPTPVMPVSSSAPPNPSATPAPSLTRKEKTWTFLLAASDATSGNADTIMVGMYDTVNQKAGLISIPRDTIYEGITPNGGHFYKINSVYAYYGAEGLAQAVSEMLGIPIDHYVTVNIKGFKALVNAVDGVDVNIPVYMDYDDPTQDLHIHYSAGMTHLNGQQAMEVARFRHNNDGKPQVSYTDIQRTQMQQTILKAIAKKVLSNPQKIGQYVEIFSQYVTTDLDLSEMLWFVEPALGFDMENLSNATLPGDSAVTYKGWTWCHQLDREESLALINEMVNPYTTPVMLDMTNMPQK
ncbi:LCP family protein [Pseudoflavonifractor sp. 524-17]|uniref:LCP family protein n=1 Tax=Pseudoflavonifractor sp. 524-17 TaxID=2304577 RepID=UPI00192A54DB|nr:LCP family protein [Pseudoflavonifractor sp. 524-17]